MQNYDFYIDTATILCEQISLSSRLIGFFVYATSLCLQSSRIACQGMVAAFGAVARDGYVLPESVIKIKCALNEFRQRVDLLEVLRLRKASLQTV